MFYGKGLKSFYCDTSWILSSDSNSNIFCSQARASSTPTTYRVKKYQLGRFDAWKLNKLLTLIPVLALFLHIIFIGGHEVGAIDYCIGGRIIKMNWLVLGLILFTLPVVNLPVISPCTITVIARCKQFVLIFVAVHSGCCQIFYIWNHRLLGDPFW